MQTVRAAPPPLQLAADMVAAAVNERILGGQAARLPLEAADRRGWQPSYVLANCYADGRAGVGPHSDRLSKLGPCPIIASLSLGAARTFRLHRQQRLQLPSLEGGAGSSSGGGAAAAAAAVAAGAGYERVDVELPHNSLLVMWPPCQEAWKHEARLRGGRLGLVSQTERQQPGCRAGWPPSPAGTCRCSPAPCRRFLCPQRQVPKTLQPLRRHPTAGSTRLNLTFRRLKPEWEARAPACACGRPAAMRAWVPKEAAGGTAPATQLRYCYICDTMRGPSCGFWQAAPHVVRLA